MIGPQLIEPANRQRYRIWNGPLAPGGSQFVQDLAATRSTDSCALRADIERQVGPVALHVPTPQLRRAHQSDLYGNQDRPESCLDRTQPKDGLEAFDLYPPVPRAKFDFKKRLGRPLRGGGTPRVTREI